MNPQPAAQIPGVYHRKIGDIVVTAISDGYLDGTLDVMRNVDLEKARQILSDAFRPARRTSVTNWVRRPAPAAAPAHRRRAPASARRPACRGPSAPPGRPTG